MKILALDLSSRSTGYAVKDGDKLIDYGCISQSASKNYIERIYTITEKILEIIAEHNISTIYCEEVRFGDANVHTFKTLMYLQSHIVCEVYMKLSKDIQFEFFQPSEHRAKVGIKTGRGVTREMCKAAAINYVMQKYGITVNDDIADAITIADAASKIAPPAAKLGKIGEGPSAF